MNSEAAQERIISLSNDIHNYNHLYYVENKSVISDYEFDLLLKELQDLEKIYDFIRMLDCEGYPNAFIETEKFKYEFSNASFNSDDKIVLANVRISKK